MFSTHFYFGLIRKYVILVGTLFNNIRIKRTDSSGNETFLYKVPITYANKDKMLARVFQDPGIDRETAIVPLPAISFEMGKMFYDGDRKLNTTGRLSSRNSDNVFNYQYNPVPYNIDFKIYIYAKNTEDGTKIIEQILPYFTPDWTTTVNLIPENNIVMDIPIILNNINYIDNFDEAYPKRRSIIWTLDLTLKGYLYGPVNTSKIIKFVKNNYYIPDEPDGQLASSVGNTNISEYVTIQPGLTSNGEPTSNASLTVPYLEVNIDDDYGFVIQTYNTEDILNE